MPLDVAIASNGAHIYVADFDGDGLPDLLIAGDNGADVYLLKPTGSATQMKVFQGPYNVMLGRTAKSPDLQRKACARRISMAMATPTSWPW